MRRILIFLGLTLLAPSVMRAQSAYQVPFSVVDEHGAQVEDISPADVQLQAGDQPATITAVRRYHNAPVRMIIVLDDSGSMGTGGKWAAAVLVLRAVLLSLPSGSSVGLVGVQEGQLEVIRHPEAIVNYVNNVGKREGGPHGQTPLFDAIHRALLELPRPRPTDVIFIISDGGDNKSKVRESGLRRELTAAGVRVSGAVVANDDDFFPDLEMGPEGLLEMFRDFAGWDGIAEPFVHHRTLNADSPELKAFLTTLYDFYIAEFTLPSQVSKPVKLKLRVRGAQPRHKGKLWVTSLERLPLGAPAVLPTAAHP